MPKVRVGDEAPDFTLPSASGGTVRLSAYRGRSEVVLFFYPRDGSPACTIEACAFRDSHEAFREAGAVVIGISGDSAESHRGFAGTHQLPYLLLTDLDGAVQARYGVSKTLGMVPGRVTFVIDRGGIVRTRYSSQINPWKHVREALQVLEALRAGSRAAAGAGEGPIEPAGGGA